MSFVDLADDRVLIRVEGAAGFVSADYTTRCVFDHDKGRGLAGWFD
jgi:hypothetical protein